MRSLPARRRSPQHTTFHQAWSSTPLDRSWKTGSPPSNTSGSLPQAIAFCCISTGVFGFPQEEAARIAVDTVRAWLDANPKADMHVIFDVYTEKDEQTYREILGE